MIFDIVVLAALLISCIIAFLRGFIREVLTILGVVGGLLAALGLGPKLAPLMRDWLGATEGETPQKLFDVIPYTVVADVLAYGAVFIVVVILLSVISHFLAGWAKAIGLGAVDRSFGVLFGAARALVLLALIYIPVYQLVDEDGRDNLFKGSRTRVYVEGTAAWMAEKISDSFGVDSLELESRANDAVSNATRARLQDMNILNGLPGRQDGTAPAGQTTDAPEAIVVPDASQPAGTDSAPGYETEERQDIRDLIEDNLTDQNTGNNFND